MEVGDHIIDVFKGASVGLEYKFRCIKDGIDFAIYNMESGQVVEIITGSDYPIIDENRALKKLYEINGLEQVPDEKTRDLLDTQS